MEELVWMVISWETFFVVSAWVFLANTVTMFLPNKSKNRYVQRLLDMLNAFSMNILRNANRIYPQRYNGGEGRKKRKVRDELSGGGP